MQKELDTLVREVLPLDRSAMTAAEEYQARLAKPPGSLGRLNKKQLLVFAADNGVVAEGVSSAPQSVTKQQTINLMRGKTGAAVLAKHFGCGLTVCDVGVNADTMAVRMTAFFLRKLSSVIPPPRPVTASTSAPSSTASTADEVVVLPMPISPTPITSASTVLAISAPVRMACKVCSRVIAGPVQIFCVP